VTYWSAMRSSRLSALLITAVTLSVVSGQMPKPRHKILFNRFLMPETEIAITDADGRNERVPAPHENAPGSLEYSPSWSADGQWIVYTRERGGQADI